MILTAHQPLYLGGWLGTFDKIAQADQHVIFDVCPQEDSGYENRNRILTQNGVQWLTVPVLRRRGQLIRDIVVANGGWQRKHWRTLELAYRKAPFWDAYAPSLESIYTKQTWAYLADLNAALLAVLMDALGLKRPVTTASTLGCQGTKSDLVLDMCRRMGASHYIFGAQGRDYADVAAFERAGITVSFQAYEHPTYPQLVGKAFEPYMCVLDLLFNVGPDSLGVITKGRTLDGKQEASSQGVEAEAGARS